MTSGHGGREAWVLDFRYLAEHDCVEAKFDGIVLHDEDDVEEWERRVRAVLEKYGRKVHLLIDLSGLIIKPKASRHFGEVRSHVLEDHALSSRRYGGDGWTRAAINTSRVLFGAGAEWYGSREDALEALDASR